ncbi:MAG: LysR family transcriptional regulator [Alsobacter sp.]
MPKTYPPVPTAALSLRVDLAPSSRLGPGKVRLLEEIDAAGSISAAGRGLAMSYRRAWELVDEMNREFRAPLVESHPGGARGGGARLTALGREIVGHYRAIEAKAVKAASLHLAALQAAVGEEPAA